VTDTPVHIDFKENGDWTAIISDKKGKAVISFSYHVTTPLKSGGIAGGAYKPADEDFKGKGVVNPKTPERMAAEAEAEWIKKNAIEQGTRPYEKN
jgi:hypothetical protein